MALPSRASRVEEGAEPLKAGEAALVGEAEPVGRGLCLRRKIGIVELRQMDDAAVVGEIIVAQLREAVEAEPRDDERVEMADEEIGEVERARLLLGERRERLLAGVKGVAMRALDTRHALFREHAVELAAGAAVAVEAEDLVVGRAIGADLGPHRIGNALGMVVQIRWQAGDVDVSSFKRQHFARQRAAGNDEDLARAVLAPRVARLSGDVGGFGAPRNCHPRERGDPDHEAPTFVALRPPRESSRLSDPRLRGGDTLRIAGARSWR